MLVLNYFRTSAETAYYQLALQLMAASAGVGKKRLLLLAAYLPAHWLVTLATSTLLFFLAVMMW